MNVFGRSYFCWMFLITALVHTTIEPESTEYHFMFSKMRKTKLECVSLNDTHSMLGCDTPQSPNHRLYL